MCVRTARFNPVVEGTTNSNDSDIRTNLCGFYKQTVKNELTWFSSSAPLIGTDIWRVMAVCRLINIDLSLARRTHFGLRMHSVSVGLPSNLCI